MNRKRFFTGLLPLSLVAASAIVGAADLGSHTRPFLACNPPLNSVRAAHGNLDFNIDTAHEFLYGVEMDGTPGAANHVPETWTREHIHLDMTHTGDYYEDDTVIGSGLDTDSGHGIDQSMLFFYAGHGAPDAWSALGDYIGQGNMLLGNCGNGSRLRYYWQCSCEVFAHGPRSCSGTTSDYACPQEFDGSNDSFSMRNVYERWGPAIDSQLRMACGVSTLANCGAIQINRIWDNYNNNGYGVADSFILGLHPVGHRSDVAPLCITTGGWSADSTPLFDTVFTNAPNPSGTYFHIQYVRRLDVTDSSFRIPETPRLIPRLRLVPPERPAFMKDLTLVHEGNFLVTPSGENLELRVRMNTRSNALYLKAVQKPFSSEVQLFKEEYIASARRHLEDKGLSEEDMGEPEVSRLMIQRVPRVGFQGEIAEIQKSVLVSFPRVIQVGGVAIDVLGEGSRINVLLSNDGSLMNIGKLWRRVEPETFDKREYARVKPYEAAYKEALGQLDDAERHTLIKADFGYKAESADVQQEEMGVVFQFVFKAAPGSKGELPPLRMVEIPAIETIEW